MGTFPVFLLLWPVFGLSARRKAGNRLSKYTIESEKGQLFRKSFFAQKAGGFSERLLRLYITFEWYPGTILGNQGGFLSSFLSRR